MYVYSIIITFPWLFLHNNRLYCVIQALYSNAINTVNPVSESLITSVDIGLGNPEGSTKVPGEENVVNTLNNARESESGEGNDIVLGKEKACNIINEVLFILSNLPWLCVILVLLLFSCFNQLKESFWMRIVGEHFMYVPTPLVTQI